MDIRNIIREYAGPGRLLDVLKAVQEQEGYLSDDALRKVADHYSIPVSRVYETATFYSMLRVDKPAAHRVEVCGSTCCDAQLGNVLLGELEEEMPENTSVTRLECLGRCDTSPNAVVDGHLILNATKEKILEALGKAGNEHGGGI